MKGLATYYYYAKLHDCSDYSVQENTNVRVYQAGSSVGRSFVRLLGQQTLENYHIQVYTKAKLMKFTSNQGKQSTDSPVM